MTEEIKPVATEKKEFEYRDESILTALFAIFYHEFDAGTKKQKLQSNPLLQV